MSGLSGRARVAGVLAFAAVWGGSALVVLQSGGMSSSVERVSTERFPAGTITRPERSEASCGDIAVRGRIVDFRAENPEPYDCVRDALDSGRRVVLVVRGRSRDDDPLRVQLRVLEEDRLELTIDNSRDQDTPGSVTTLTCTGLDDTRAPVGCE